MFHIGCPLHIDALHLHGPWWVALIMFFDGSQILHLQFLKLKKCIPRANRVFFLNYSLSLRADLNQAALNLSSKKISVTQWPQKKLSFCTQDKMLFLKSIEGHRSPSSIFMIMLLILHCYKTEMFC